MPNRKSPEDSATKHEVGVRQVGNDGNWWEVRVDKNGRHRWVRVKEESSKVKADDKQVKIYVQVSGWKKYLGDQQLREKKFTRTKYQEFTKLGTLLYMLKKNFFAYEDDKRSRRSYDGIGEDGTCYVYQVLKQDAEVFKTKAKELFGFVGLKISFETPEIESRYFIRQYNKKVHYLSLYIRNHDPVIPESTRKNIPGTYFIRGGGEGRYAHFPGYISYMVKIFKNKEVQIFKRLNIEDSQILDLAEVRVVDGQQRFFTRKGDTRSEYEDYLVEGNDAKDNGGGFQMDETRLFETKPCKVVKDAVNVFLGEGDDPKYISILVQLPKCKYIHILDEVVTFDLPGTITKFVGFDWDKFDNGDLTTYAVDSNDRIYVFDGFEGDVDVYLLPEATKLLLGHPKNVKDYLFYLYKLKSTKLDIKATSINARRIKACLNQQIS
jgi:hypothetical protein